MPGRVNERSGAVWDSDVAGMGTDSMTLVFAVASTRDGELKNDRCRFLADFHIRRCVYAAFQVADGTRYGSVTVAPILYLSESNHSLHSHRTESGFLRQHGCKPPKSRWGRRVEYFVLLRYLWRARCQPGMPRSSIFTLVRYRSRLSGHLQTCRYLNSLTFTKQLWLVLLQDAPLLLDQWPELSLHQFTTAELIDLAKRMVQGPQTWSRSHVSEPVIARQEVIHPEIYVGPGGLFWENDPKLLSGGQYLLFNSARVLECWKVAEDRLIWKHQSQWEFAWVLDFAAEVVDDSQAAVIMICQRTRNNAEPRKKCVLYLFLECHIYIRVHDSVVEVVRLDFLTETSQPLFCTQLPDTNYDNPFTHPKICGDTAILCIHITNKILLINWRTQSCIMLLASTVRQMPSDMVQSRLIDFCRSHTMWPFYPHILSSSNPVLHPVCAIWTFGLSSPWLRFGLLVVSPIATKRFRQEMSHG
jgi:hypothetical protein